MLIVEIESERIFEGFESLLMLTVDIDRHSQPVRDISVAMWQQAGKDI